MAVRFFESFGAWRENWGKKNPRHAGSLPFGKDSKKDTHPMIISRISLGRPSSPSRIANNISKEDLEELDR